MRLNVMYKHYVAVGSLPQAGRPDYTIQLTSALKMLAKPRDSTLKNPPNRTARTAFLPPRPGPKMWYYHRPRTVHFPPRLAEDELVETAVIVRLTLAT